MLLSVVSRIDELIAAARLRGLKPWLVVKERLAECAITAMARETRVVLQGGAALHFAHGSPRLSADVDFVGNSAREALAERGPEIAAAASQALGAPAHWTMRSDGRLTRGKVTIEVDAGRQIVLPVEAYAVPAHDAMRDPRFGQVERAGEIAADKVVASASRLARRGVLKTRDLYDLWFIRTRLGLPPPPTELVAKKMLDYGQARCDLDVAAAARATSAEEMTASLQGVLPAGELVVTDAAQVVEAAADWLERYRDVV